MLRFEMPSFGKKTAKVEAALPPLSEKSAQFVADAKAKALADAEAAKAKAVVFRKAQLREVAGRVVYSPTPVMSDAEAAEFLKLPPLPPKGAAIDLPEGWETATDPVYGEIKKQTDKRITSAGFYDLDKQVPTVSIDAEKAGIAHESATDAKGVALDLPELRKNFITLSDEVKALEAERDRVPVAEPLRWAEINQAMKEKRAEKDALGKQINAAVQSKHLN